VTVAKEAVSKAQGLVPVVLTFDPHPAAVLAPERAPKLIMTIDQRLRAMQAEGIEAVFLLPSPSICPAVG